ncbi:hypothetical protein [Truepera radiovictrix]|nr:hypothetical protein [Truepera radiovictrix]
MGALRAPTLARAPDVEQNATPEAVLRFTISQAIPSGPNSLGRHLEVYA